MFLFFILKRVLDPSILCRSDIYIPETLCVSFESQSTAKVFRLDQIRQRCGVSKIWFVDEWTLFEDLVRRVLDLEP